MRLVAPLTIFMLSASCATPTYGSEPTDIHYNIISSLDYSSMTIAEHTQILFRADSNYLDSLLFWKVEVDKWQEMHFDSITVNGTRVETPPEDYAMCIYSNGEDSTITTLGQDNLVFSLPATNLIEDNINRIDFYYNFMLSNDDDPAKDYAPEALGYADYYPRLVRDMDSIYIINQKYSFETISLKIRMEHGLHFMSAVEPYKTILHNGDIEYSIDNLSTRLLVWFVFPDKYYQEIRINPIRFETYRSPCLNIDTEARLGEIAGAIEFYGEQFGTIPYEKINILFITLPENIGGGTLNNFIFLSNGKAAASFIDKAISSLNEFQTVLAHEAAHLWWGSDKGISDDWISEGLASYWSDRYAILVKNQAAYSSMHYDAGRILYRVQSMMENRAENGKDDFVSHYYKAPYIMNMLALQMGNDNFTKACREFYREYRNNIPGFEEFKETTNKYSEVPLDSFFTCWVDSNYSQNYFIDHVKSNRVDTLYHNSIDLGKTGKASSYVPVAVRYKDETEESFLLPPNQLSHAWKSQSRIASVFIDPDKLILETQRYDNAQPAPIKFHSLKLNLSENIKLATSFLGDEPEYDIYLLPDFPVYSERFGWDFSAVLLGKSPDFLGDYYMDDVDIARIGYNTRDNDLIYRLYLSKSILSKPKWKTTGNISINKMRGKYDFGAGIKYGRAIAGLPFFAPVFRASVSMAHRRYYPLEDVNDEIWPERETTPIKLQISWESYVSTDFELEWGIKASQDDQEYYRYSMTLESKSKYFHGRAFIGTSGDDAVQERFDPSYEGGMKSYPSFKYYYRELVAINMLLKHPLVSFINLRLFSNHINSMIDGHSASEAGFGLMFGSEMAGLIVDMPTFVSDTDIDGNRWSASRFRIQLHLISYKGIPKWDFLIN